MKVIKAVDVERFWRKQKGVGRQGGRVVRGLEFESVGPGFESHSEHFMDLFHGSPEL